MNVAQHALVLVLRVYRWALSPAKALVFGPLGRCRFTPTCSAYALEAIQTHGALRGAGLALRRLCRCQPWNAGGYDPVPPQAEARSSRLEAHDHPAPATNSDKLAALSRGCLDRPTALARRGSGPDCCVPLAPIPAADRRV